MIWGMLFPNHTISLGTTAPPLPFPRFGLSAKDDNVHATVWGRTGSGKSKLLQSVFLQRVRKGQGVGLIEPHHDLSFDCLTYLVGRRFFAKADATDRLVYLDWGNDSYVPFNVLASRGDSYTAALNALEAMLRVWPELTAAPMFQTLFLSSMVVLVANELPITFLYPLLSDQAFRRRCLGRINDPLIVQSFEHFDHLGRDQAQLAGSTLRRAFLLMFSPVIRHTLGQPDNWLDFRRIMDEGKAVIINLGNIQDQDTRRLLGAMLMVQIEQAALSRTDIPPCARTPFTLLVDEWPSFAAQDRTIGTILSQTRKFNLRLWLAAQSLSQISSERLSGAIENCRLTVVFGLGRDSAEVQARQIGRADTMLVKDEAHTDAQHPQFFSVPEQWESWVQDLQQLPPQMAYAKLHDRPAVRIKTLTIKQPPVSPSVVSEVLAAYRQRYQRSRKEAETAMRRLPRIGGSNTGAVAADGCRKPPQSFKQPVIAERVTGSSKEA
jgi:hypothetical protein